MSLLRAVAAVSATLLLAAPAQAEHARGAPGTPKSLKPFLVSVDEAPTHSFPRTPSFAWSPVRNAASYEFELSTSDAFGEGSVIWSTTTLKTPAVSIPVALPWLTGKPYALYAHVRAVSPLGATSPWSPAYGFNVRWANVPTKLPGTEYPGLVQ